MNAAIATMFRESGTYRHMADCLKKSRRKRTFQFMTTRRKTVPRKHTKPTRNHGAKRTRNSRKTHYWSGRVTRESDALTIEKRIMSSSDPKRIAASLKRSAERSHRRKSSPYRSAMSMLTFFINRAGKNLSASRKRVLNRAKQELRKQFGRA
jgi:hypothetical protein